MSHANARRGETHTHTTPPSGVCVAFLRAFIRWLTSLAPIARANAAAAHMLLVIFDLLNHPDLDETSDCFASDARHIARYLDVADALVSASIWLMARKRAGLSLDGNGGQMRILPRRKAPTRAALIARYTSIHRRFVTAEARAARLAARMIPSDALARLEATFPQSAGRPDASAAPAAADAAPDVVATSAHRPGLLERALAIVRAALPISPTHIFAPG